MTLGKNNTDQSKHVCLLKVVNYTLPYVTSEKEYCFDISFSFSDAIVRQCRIFSDKI